MMWSISKTKTLSALFVAVLLFALQPHSAKAQWVVSDPITESMTAATAVVSALELIELQKINGALATLHTDSHLQVMANKKVGLGAAQAGVDQSERATVLPPLETASADATVSDDGTGGCSATKGHEANNDGNIASRAMKRILAGFLAIKDTGKLSGGVAPAKAKEVVGDCLAYDPSDTIMKAICSQQNP